MCLAAASSVFAEVGEAVEVELFSLAGCLGLGFIDELLHADEAGLVEGLEEFEGGEEESSGAAGGVKDGDGLDGLVEAIDEVFRAGDLDGIDG